MLSPPVCSSLWWGISFPSLQRVVQLLRLDSVLYLGGKPASDAFSPSAPLILASPPRTCHTVSYLHVPESSPVNFSFLAQKQTIWIFPFRNKDILMHFGFEKYWCVELGGKKSEKSKSFWLAYYTHILSLKKRYLS